MLIIYERVCVASDCEKKKKCALASIQLTAGANRAKEDAKKQNCCSAPDRPLGELDPIQDAREPLAFHEHHGPPPDKEEEQQQQQPSAAERVSV